MNGFFSRISEIIKDMCFPPSCYICNEFTETNGLCTHCWGHVKWISEPKCEICGIPFEIPIQKICDQCMKKKPHFDKAISVFVYDKFSKKMILFFKNGDCTYMANQFARWMFRVAEKDMSDADLIIPVPIAFSKRLKRKYNQSELLAMELSKLSHVKYNPMILNKIKPTKPQEGLTKRARMKNLSGSFGVDEKYAEELREKNIVLVDDVVTTGATANECAKVLKKHGAKKVVVVSVARVTLNDYSYME